MTEKLYPSHAPEIKAGGPGWGERKEGKCCLQFVQEDGEVEQWPRVTPHQRGLKATWVSPIPQLGPKTQENYVGGRKRFGRVSSGARWPQLESWIVCNLGQVMSFPVPDFLICKMGIISVTTSEGCPKAQMADRMQGAQQPAG